MVVMLLLTVLLTSAIKGNWEIILWNCAEEMDGVTDEAAVDNGKEIISCCGSAQNIERPVFNQKIPQIRFMAPRD